MKIHKTKTGSYNSVDTEYIASYIQTYAYAIDKKVNNAIDENGKILPNKRLMKANRTQLKSIAAELETICKRLNYIIDGEY